MVLYRQASGFWLKEKLLERKDLFGGKNVFKNLARYMLNHRPLL